MVLPANTTLRPGDALQSKPKQAMFVRMSAESLQALESIPTQSTLRFQFGDSPGMYIGDSYFTMRYSEENTQNDLYLRTSSATKKNAPLKLFANVVGKFSVERELDDPVRDKVRESTQDAANQRNSRTTVFIDTPDLPSTSGKKRKDPPAMFRKPLRPSDKPKPAPVPVLANKLPPVTNLSPHRKHIVRLLAVSERTVEDIMNNLNASEGTPPSRREVQDLLEQLADFTPPKPGSTDKPAGSYSLKSIVWKEVRPYEWTELTDQQRTVVARVARIKFQSLGIPESDASWDHVRYRSPAANIPAQSKPSPSVIAEASTRGGPSRETKDRKPKPKNDPKVEAKEIQSTPRSTLVDDRPKGIRPKDTPESTRMGESASVESPAGGKKVPLATKTTKSNARPSDLHASSKAPPARNTERDVPSSTLLPKHNASRVEEKVPPQKFKKLPRDSGIAESEKDNRPSSHIAKTSAKDRSGRREADDDSFDDRKPSQLKRKNAEQDHDRVPNPRSQPIPAKRRKTEGEHSTIPSREDRSQSGKRPSMDSRTSEKTTGAPQNASKPRTKDEISASKRHPLSNEKMSSYPPSSSNARVAGSQGSKTTSTKRNPRRSPVFTSSEEGEEEEDAPLKPRAPTKPAVASSEPSTSRRPRIVAPRSLPTDHGTLRARYNASYLEYLTSFQRLVTQKGKIDHLLKSTDLESIGSITDSEGDMELLDPEELSQLAIKHKKLEEELEAIQEIFRVG